MRWPRPNHTLASSINLFLFVFVSRFCFFKLRMVKQNMDVMVQHQLAFTTYDQPQLTARVATVCRAFAHRDRNKTICNNTQQLIHYEHIVVVRSCPIMNCGLHMYIRRVVGSWEPACGRIISQSWHIYESPGRYSVDRWPLIWWRSNLLDVREWSLLYLKFTD